MISEKMKGIIETIKNQGEMRFIEAATKEQISQFEQENNIHLPVKYKEWLLYSDGGEFFLPAGIQMYGVAHKPIIDINDNDRPDDKYIVIGAMSFGDPILCEKEGETISIYNHEDGCIEEDEIYEDFISFLKDLGNLLGVGE